MTTRSGWTRSARTLAVMCLVVVGGLGAQETGAIEGRVVAAEGGAPLSGIRVEVLGTLGAAVTDDDGVWSISGLPAGPVEVRFTWYGYRDLERSVTVREGATATIDVEMTAEPLMLGEILVTTASRQPERVLETPAAIDVVSPARVREVAPTGQTPLLLGELAGVQVMQSGINSFNVISRGFNTLGPRGMLVLMDGIDMGNPFVGAQEWPITSVTEEGAQVEVVRGPGSALYGANAYNGVVNIKRPTARQMQGTRLTLSGGERSSLGLDARHAGVFGGLRWGYAVDAGYSRAESFDVSRTDLGDLDREYADAPDGAGSHPAPGFELLPLRGQSKAAPFGTPGPATGTPDPLTVLRGSARLDHYLVGGGVVTAEAGMARSENQVDGSSVGRAQVVRSDRPWARLALGTDRHSVTAYYTGRRGEQTALAAGANFADESDRLHLEAQTRMAFAGERGQAVIGGSARNDRLDSKGQLFAPQYDGRSDQYYSAFGQVGFELVEGLRATGAVRFDDASLFDARLSPKLGLVWTDEERHSVRFTWGTAYLMPAPAQRFLQAPAGPPIDLYALEAGLRASPLGPALAGVADGALLTNSAAVPLLAIGNLELDPEEVRSFEAGYRTQRERVFFSVDAWLSRFENFQTSVLPGVNPSFMPWTAPTEVAAPAIDAVETAVRDAVPGITRLPDGSTAIVLSTTGAGRAEQWGVDLAAGLRVTDEVQVDANYSYVTVDFEEGSFIGADSIPANAPAHSMNVAGSFTSPDGIRVRVGLTVTSSFDFLVGLWDGTVPGRQTIDVSTSREVTSGLVLGVSATNVLDQQRFHYFGGSIVGRRVLAYLTWRP